MVSGAERVVRIAPADAKPGDLTGYGDQTKGQDP